jgi:hypothetical protein
MHTNRTGIITRVAIITDIDIIDTGSEVQRWPTKKNQGSHRVLGRVKAVSALLSPDAI